MTYEFKKFYKVIETRQEKSVFVTYFRYICEISYDAYSIKNSYVTMCHELENNSLFFVCLFVSEL